MAHTPYLRYETTNEALDGISGPVFPNRFGGRFYSRPGDKRLYGTTERLHGTTNESWNIEDIKKTRRDEIWDFWNTTLERGYHDCTLIDNRKRMLFDTSWNDWSEVWKKGRGGIHDIDIDYQSPAIWTSPLFGAYPLTANNFNEHMLTGDDLSLDGGTLVNYAADNDILRQNGYALRLEGDTATAYGATGTVSWNTTVDNSISVYCQFMIDTINNTGTPYVYLWWLTDGTNYVRLKAEYNDASTGVFIMELSNGGSTSTMTTLGTFNYGTWYDVGFTYNAQNDYVAIYFTSSGTTTFTDYFDDETNIDNQLEDTLSAAVYPAQTAWNTVRLLREAATGELLATEYAYLQNVFFIDSYISPIEFNTFRRWCYVWNNKTSGTWPK